MPAPQPRWMQAPPAPTQDKQPKWMQAPPVEAAPAKPPQGMVADPLSKSGFAPAPKPQQDPIAPRSEWGGGYKAALATAPEQKPWNENVADILQQGADFLLEPLMSRNRGLDMAPENDLPGEAAKMIASGTANLPAAVFRDPNQAVKDYDPFHQLGYGYNNMVDAGGDAIEGNFGTAAEKAKEGAGQLAFGALGLTGVRGSPKGAPAPLKATTLQEAKREAAMSSVQSNAPRAVEPSLRQTGKTLAATAVPGRAIRPQAAKAIERILVASNVPGDRVRSGMAKVIQLLQAGVDSPAVGSVRAPTVAQLLEREFAEEFPEVSQNIRTVLLERRLTKDRKDSSPTIVRDAAQEMRGSQVQFLDESANRNLGDKSRGASRADVEENLRQIGEEGYSPIVKQPADPARAKTIQNVLNGPGMNELGRPLRQIAAGEGVDIDTMIAKRPIEAAHWMQHKARLLAAENEGTTLGNAYNAMRSRILTTIDDLKAPDGQTYAQIRARYGDEAGIKDALTAGDRFGAIVRNPDGANRFIEAFKGATPEQQAAQLASIRDWAQSKLRGGGEEGAARMSELQNIAVLDTLDKLGVQGKALADDIRAVRDEERFLGGFYPKSESATANNMSAMAQGADIYSRPGASSLPTNALADGALMASGLSGAPILTAMRQGPKLYRGIMQPRRSTREDMTRVLMSRPERRRQAQAATPTNSTPPKIRSAPPAPSTGLGGPQSSPIPAVNETPSPAPTGAAAMPVSGLGTWEGPKPQKPQSLLAWIRSQGGIKDKNYMSGDLKSVMGKANAMPGLLNNQSGKGLDDIVSAAYEQGFDVNPDDANSLMRLIEEEMAGNPSYRIGAREEWDIYQEYLAAKRGDLPGQTSSASPTVTGALVGGGLGYVASDGDPVATFAGATGLGAAAGLGAKMLKGGKPKPAASAKPAFDQRFMKEAQRLVSYNGGVDKALKAQQYVIDQLKNSKAPNAQDRLNRAVSIQYAIRRMAERSNRELDEIVPMADAAPTGPKPIDPNTNYNIDPRGDKFVIRTDAGEEVLGAPKFADRKQALAWLQGETRKARKKKAPAN
jgi:hypothetical protein